MDVFAAVDIDSIQQKLESSIDSDVDVLQKEKSDSVVSASLSAKWLPSKGLEIFVPQSLLKEMGWGDNTKLDMILHDNVIILYPMNGFLNLRKALNKAGRTILVKKENFRNSDKMSEFASACKIWEDDVTCYYRLMLQFPEPLPNAFSY